MIEFALTVALLGAPNADVLSSADPDTIRAALPAFRAGATDAASTAHHLKAYYRYYDELAERNRDAERGKAADAAHELAKKARAAYPKDAQVRYWAAMADVAYLEMNQMKALFIAGDLLAELETARKLDPTVDDWGPDRMLGILYGALPGWPLSKGDVEKGIKHLTLAAEKAPDRAVNRLRLAIVLLKADRRDEAKPHLDFLQKNQWRVSSAHWRKITERQIAETVKEAGL